MPSTNPPASPSTSFVVSCRTTASEVPVEMTFTRSWGANGFDRLYELFSAGYYDDTVMYRVVPNFLTQFGVSTHDEMNKRFGWPNTIPDDPRGTQPFKKGTISFAGSGPNSRATDIFICDMENGGSLGKGSPWEVPLGEVTSGIEVVEQFYSGYGDIDAFNKKGVSQQKLRNKGESYVNNEFPLLSRFAGCEMTSIDGSDPRTPLEPMKNEDIDRGGRFNRFEHNGVVHHGENSSSSVSGITADRFIAAIIMVLSGFSALILTYRLCSSGGKKSRRFEQ